MEYVDGENLHALRAKSPDKVLKWEFLEPLMRQLGSALDYAHAENVIHRDLKPANVMVDKSGRLKLSDFGLAAIVSDSMSRMSEATSTSGTIGYMSPQQADGKKPCASDDIYALGVTLYELLTSTAPFHSGDIGYQVRHTAAEPMEQRLAALGLTNEIPQEVSAAVMACLAKEPEERPQTAGALLELIDGTHGAVRAPRREKVAKRWKARTAVLAVTAAIAAGVVSFVMNRPADGVERIFNGRDLRGWEGDPSLWSVKDGAITASSEAEGVTRRENTCLIWHGNVGDFELSLQFRARDVISEKPANSGVLYRSRRVANPQHAWQVRGYQVDLHGAFTGTLLLLEDTLRDPRSEWGRTVVLRRANGEITMQATGRTTTLPMKEVVRAGDWNELVITAKGNHLVHRINGVTVMEAIDETGGAASGRLALEMKRATQIKFKDIRLRRL
jgi:hypothetical protein